MNNYKILIKTKSYEGEGCYLEEEAYVILFAKNKKEATEKFLKHVDNKDIKIINRTSIFTSEIEYSINRYFSKSYTVMIPLTEVNLRSEFVIPSEDEIQE